MSVWGMVILAAVQLGGAFGSASAEVEELSDESMVVVFEVEVQATAEAVVAHLTFDNETELTMPLLDRGGGVFGARTELEPKNYIVVFEAIDADDGLSEPMTLIQLGADLDRPGVETTSSGGEAPEDELTDETRRTGWLAVALGAASLSVLAFWVLGGRDREKDGATEGEIDESGPTEPEPVDQFAADDDE